MKIAGKGILLLGLFVAIGVFVLSEGFKDTSSNSAPSQETPVVEEESESSSTSETESSEEEVEEISTAGDDAPPTESASNGVLHPPAEVRVLVANGTNVSGAASAIKEVLVSDQGYNGLAPVNDTSEEVPTETVVYYANGYELDAINIAVIINVKNNILAMPAVLPVTDLNEANILVLLGSDLYPEE